MASIKEVILKMQKQTNDKVKDAISNQAVYGTVEKIKDEKNNPLVQIRIDANLLVTEKINLILSPLVKDPLLESGLQVGDKVLMLSLNDGTLLYAMQKI